MPKRSTKLVCFVEIPPTSSFISPRALQTAFRVRPPTPYPVLSLVDGISIFPADYSPSECRLVESEYEAKFACDTREKFISELADADGGAELGTVAGPRFILEPIPELDTRNKPDEPVSRGGLKLETKREQGVGSIVTQSSGSGNNPGTSCIQYQILSLIPVAPLEASDLYPQSNPGTTIFSDAMDMALEHYAPSTDTFTNPDGSHCDIDKPEGLVFSEDGIVIDPIANEQTPISRPPFSFSYAGTHMAHSSSATSARSVPECLPEYRHHHHKTGTLHRRNTWPR